MSDRVPRWAQALLERSAGPKHADEALGDLDEAHRLRVGRHGRILAALLTGLEAIDMARALRRTRRSRPTDVSPAAPRRALPVSWLDFKLGIRMLARYPGLTLVAGFAMAFTVWVGAVAFELITQVVRPKIPLEEGDRIVALQLLDRVDGDVARHAGLDFLRWRESLEGVENLGAVRTSFMNLVIDGDVDGSIGAPVVVSAMTASGFELARIPPRFGRFLLPGDEADGAVPVVVLSHDIWETRFGEDPGVIGTVVRLGVDQATVVGVMPDGFGFPFIQDVWTALPTSTLQSERREVMPISVFGRLADGATMGEIEAQLALHASRMAAEFPETHGRVSAHVLPHGVAFLGIPPDQWRATSMGILSFNLIPILLLLLIAANVALLMFARAATREGEIVVRSALGAGRARIVGQLFAESLVLGTIAAGVGLFAASFGLRWALHSFTSAGGDGMARFGALPFWFHASLSPMTIVYAVVLTLLGATLSGVLPGLKVTRALGHRLRTGTSGGGGLQFGGVWTAVIIAQVAITIPFPAVIFALRAERTGVAEAPAGLPVEEYLAFRVELETPDGPQTSGERFDESVAELERRLESDPRVRSVTSADRLPRMSHVWRRIEVLEGGAEPPAGDSPGHVGNPVFIAPDYFEAMDAPILSGRAFASEADSAAVIVNETFVDLVLGGRSAVGRHVRYLPYEVGAEPAADEPWYEIVGVVPDLSTWSGGEPRGGIYHPITRATSPLWFAARVSGDPSAFAPELRSMAHAVDPALEIHGLTSLADVVLQDLNFFDFWITLVVVVCGIALVLSLAGIYAAMSFAVSRRTREIGVRVALGAGRHGIVWSIFRRPILQLCGGLLLGTGLTAALFGVAQEIRVAFILPYAVVMTLVISLACVVPTRRALGIEPSEALRSE